MYSKNDVKTYEFASIKFSVRNYRGLHFLSEKVVEAIKALTADEVKAVNKEAWKQKKKTERLANKHCNMSYPGNMDIYEENGSHCHVAEQVCKISYKKMMGYILTATAWGLFL